MTAKTTLLQRRMLPGNVLLTFDPEEHRFSIGGRRAYGTSAVMLSAGITTPIPEIMRPKLERGRRIHTGIELALSQDLDPDSMEAEEYANVQQALKAIREMELTPLEGGPEQLVGSAKYMVATKIDYPCLYKGKPCLVNWKSASKIDGELMGHYPIQTALEALLWQETTQTTDKPLRMVLKLTGEAYAPVWHEDASDYEVALAAITVHRWRKGRL